MPSVKNTEELQVTSASAWKGAAKEGLVTELPSGNVVKLRRSMDILHLLKAGRIPNPLAGIVQNMLHNGKEVPDMDEVDENTISQMLKLVDETVVKSVVEPKVVPIPEPEEDEDAEAYQIRIQIWEQEEIKDGEVPLSWIDLDDRMFIFVFSQGFAADLESFRAEQASTVASMANVKKTPAKTKRTGGGK